MNSRQKKRQSDRQPVEEKVRLELQDLVEDQASVDVELHDHDDIQGGVIWVDLKASLSSQVIEQLRLKIVQCLKASVPQDHPLATWSLVIRQNRQEVASSAWFDD